MSSEDKVLLYLYDKFEQLNVPFPVSNDNSEAYFYINALYNVIEAEDKLVEYLLEVDKLTEDFSIIYDDKPRTTGLSSDPDLGILTRDFYIDLSYPNLSILLQDIPEQFENDIKEFKNYVAQNNPNIAVKSVEPLDKNKGIFRINFSYIYNHETSKNLL